MIGEGGFGRVFKGWIDENTYGPTKPGTGIVVAIKNLKPESFQGHKEWLVCVTTTINQSFLFRLINGLAVLMTKFTSFVLAGRSQLSWAASA